MKIIFQLFLILFFLHPLIVQSQEKNTYVINDLPAYNPAGISTIDTYRLHVKTYNNSFFNDYFSGSINIITPIKKINSHISIYAEFYNYDNYYNYDNFSDNKIDISYSYSFHFSETSKLAIAARFSKYTVKEKIRCAFFDNYDDEYQSSTKDVKSDIFNLDLGIWFQNNNLGIGIMYDHVNNPKHKYTKR